MSEEMKVNPVRAKELLENITHVVERIRAVNKTGKNVRDFLSAELRHSTSISKSASNNAD